MGYEVDAEEGRQRSAAQIEPMLRRSASDDEVQFQRHDPDTGYDYYRTYPVITGPNKRRGRIVAVWEDRRGLETRLVTTYVQPFKEGKNDDQ